MIELILCLERIFTYARWQLAPLVNGLSAVFCICCILVLIPHGLSITWNKINACKSLINFAISDKLRASNVEHEHKQCSTFKQVTEKRYRLIEIQMRLGYPANSKINKKCRAIEKDWRNFKYSQRWLANYLSEWRSPMHNSSHYSCKKAFFLGNSRFSLTIQRLGFAMLSI